MKKVKFCLIILCVMFLCGCSSNKTEVSLNDFSSIVSDLGYETKDVSDDYAYSSSTYSFSDYGIEGFYAIGNKAKDIRNVFADEAQNAVNDASVNATTKTESGNNWASVKLIDDDKIYYVAYVDKSLLYIKADVEKKDIVNKLIKEMNY